MTLEEMEKGIEEEKTSYIKIIGNYLLSEARQNENLKNKIESSNRKTLKGCFEYIKAQAKKQAVNSCAVVEDSEVFHWAREYFEEDEIEPEEKSVETKKPKQIEKPAENTLEPQKEENDLKEQEAVSNSEDKQEVIQEVKPRKTKEKGAKTAQSDKMSLFDFEF